MIRIAGIERDSIVDGPGLRFVIFCQGCPHNCYNCHNPGTHSFSGGTIVSVEDILMEIDKNPIIKGITLSGGEPLCQAKELLPLISAMKERKKDIICYSGYTFDELLEKSQYDFDIESFLSLVDILIDGRYLDSEKDLTLRFRGSRNQCVLDSKRSMLEKKAVVTVI